MCNRGWVFALFTKSQFTPSQVPLQVNSATTRDLIHSYMVGGRGGGDEGGGPKAPLFSNKMYAMYMPGISNNVSGFYNLWELRALTP